MEASSLESSQSQILPNVYLLLAGSDLYLLLPKKPVLIYIVLSWVLWVILSNHQAWGHLWICAQLIWCEGGPGNSQTSGWCQKSWADLAVWRTVPFTQSWSKDLRYAGARFSDWLEFGVLRWEVGMDDLSQLDAYIPVLYPPSASVTRFSSSSSGTDEWPFFHSSIQQASLGCLLYTQQGTNIGLLSCSHDPHRPVKKKDTE